MRKQRERYSGKSIKGTKLQTAVAIIVLFSLVACEGLPFDLNIPWLMPESDTPTITPTLEIVAPTADPSAELESTPAPPPESLTIWIPPEFDPAGDSQAANLLKAQLQTFSDNNNGIVINLRVKDASGPGGLLDALTATSAAAPAVLPDLIALQRKDLETAALKSLVYPLDNLTSITDDTDWYPYARDMALIQGVVFGVPFAGDALALIYQTSKVESTPSTWEGFLEALNVVAFPANDSQAYFTLALYQAAGGAVQDNQRRPALDAGPLTEVFKLYQSGVSSGDFSNLLLEYQSENQVWQAYQEG
ncbi:MAG: extracellular solute-binding protein, partial [Chloroflexota bacterium]